MQISRSFDGNCHTGSFQENQEWKLPNHSYWGTWEGVATVSACLSVGMSYLFFCFSDSVFPLSEYRSQCLCMWGCVGMIEMLMSSISKKYCDFLFQILLNYLTHYI